MIIYVFGKDYLFFMLRLLFEVFFGYNMNQDRIKKKENMFNIMICFDFDLIF